MRRIITLATAALTLAGAVAASGPAAAQYRRHWDRDRDRGDAVAAGVLGFALGAAVAGGANAPRYSSRGYYDPGYAYGPPRGYGRGYGYGYRRPARCVIDRQWDPYWGRYVRVERCW